MDSAWNFKERVTDRVTFVVRDSSGAAIPQASLTTITLTLYDKLTDGIINSRNDQNVNNANQVTIGADGTLVWDTVAADNAIINPNLAVEEHVALFEWTYSAGAKAGKHEAIIRVVNLGQVS
jgi:hypothetical protein